MRHPTIGDIVHYHPGLNRDNRTMKGQPMAAVVCCVHSPGIIAVSVWDQKGRQFPRTDVPLMAGDEEVFPAGDFCTWPPVIQEEVGAAISPDDATQADAESSPDDSSPLPAAEAAAAVEAEEPASLPPVGAPSGNFDGDLIDGA